MKKTLLMATAIVAALAMSSCKTKEVLSETTYVAEPIATYEDLRKESAPITYTVPKRVVEDIEETVAVAAVVETEPETSPETIYNPVPVMTTPVTVAEPEPEVKPEPVVKQPEPVVVKQPEPVVAPQPTPAPVVSTPKTSQPVVNPGDRQEKVILVDAKDAALLKDYNVVVGSFGNRTNADNMQKKMASRGFNSFLVQNEGGMFRVVAGGYDSHNDAVTVREDIRSTYANEKGTCAGAWILVPKR